MPTDGMFHRIIAHGMLGAGLISSGPRDQTPRPRQYLSGPGSGFLHPVGIGDTITATVTVTEKHRRHRRPGPRLPLRQPDGETVICGTARVRAPTEKISRPRIELPEVQLSRHGRFRALLAQAAGGMNRWLPPSRIPATPCARCRRRGGQGRPDPADAGRPAGQDPQAGRRAGVDISSVPAGRHAA